jgi:hypothetical protein
MWLFSFKNLGGQTAHWVQRLKEHNITSTHCQRQKLTNINALSRRPWLEACAHYQEIHDSHAPWRYMEPFYKMWKLQSILSGRILLTTVPPIMVTRGLLGLMELSGGEG